MISASRVLAASPVAPSAPVSGSSVEADGLAGRRGRVNALGCGVGAALLCLVAFVAGGGDSLGANTWVQIVTTVAGTALMAAAVFLGALRRQWGTLAWFAALAVLSAASIAWSVTPNHSWLEANRTLSYMAAFAGAVALARLFPARWPALIGAVAVAATIVSGWALLVKVFPATLDPSATVGRLEAPFGYWNAVGLMAAMGLPACLWAGARRQAGLVRALAVPAIAILVATIMLSYSRGALLVAIAGLALWFALVPLRLRAALLLGLGAVGGGLVIAWALSTHPLTHDGAALAARTTAGHSFGLVLVATVVVLALAGLVAGLALDRTALSEGARRRIGKALVVMVALLPAAGVGAVAASSRGLTGEISHAWQQLTSPTSGGAPDTPGRLFQVGSTRGRYWNEGLRVGEHALFKGVGAYGYAVARTRWTVDSASVLHAHSYVIQTFADFGLLGLAISAALLASWSRATRRALRLRGGAHQDERDGLVTLLSVVVAFGLSSLIDWTWFIPGVTVTALVCAGWLAGRGPLGAPAARGATAAGEAPTGTEAPRRALAASAPAVAGAAICMAAVALLISWLVLQPLRSADADAAALSAAARGDGAAALADARAAVADDPESVDAKLQLANLYAGAGQRAAAIDQLNQSIALQPDDPQMWLSVAGLDINLHRPAQARDALRHAYALDRGGIDVLQTIHHDLKLLGLA